MVLTPIETIKSNISEIPIVPGQMISCYDTNELYFDTKNKERISISDIIHLNTEEQRRSLLAPLPNKIYLVKESAKMYISDGENWYLLNDQVSVSVTLEMTEAQSGVLIIKGKQTIPVTLAKLVFTNTGKTVEDRINEFQNSLDGLCIKTYTYSSIPESGNKTIAIEHPNFNKDKDVVSVYKGSTKLFNNIDYNIENTSIKLIDIVPNGVDRFVIEIFAIAKI